MSIEWEQYRGRYASERPETFAAYVDVWTSDPEARQMFTGWVTFGQCANAEPAKREGVPHLVEQAEQLMVRNGYSLGPSTSRGARRWIANATDSVDHDHESRRAADGRNFTGKDLRRALDAFGQHDGLEANKRSAVDIIEKLMRVQATAISTVYWRAGDAGKVAVRFECEPDLNAAEIHFGFVWHRSRLPGAEPSTRDGTWFTNLPVHRSRSGNSMTARTQSVECPNDPGMMVPVTGSCMCGWSPLDDA